MGESGTPEWIRTTDLLLRRQTLYPAELRAHTSADCTPIVTRLRRQRAGSLLPIAHRARQSRQAVPEARCATMLSTGQVFHLAERWLSGRKQRFAKPSYWPKPVPGGRIPQ